MPPTLTGAPLADPDGRRWVAPAADHTLTLMGADGVVRSLRPAPGDTVSDLLAWTRAGIWVVRGTPGTRVGDASWTGFYGRRKDADIAATLGKRWVRSVMCSAGDLTASDSVQRRLTRLTERVAQYSGRMRAPRAGVRRRW